MTKSKKSQQSRQAKKIPKNKSRTQQKSTMCSKVWQFIKIPLLKFCAVSMFVFTCYLGYLDYTVREKFAGKRWAIPARVYASPVEIYAGLKINAQQLLTLLKKLHYRADSQLSSQATYYKDAQTIRLKTRQFVFSDKAQAMQYIHISFVENAVHSIKAVASGKELAIVRLDPVQIGSFYPAHKEDRVLVKLNEVPKTLIKGLLTTEDRDFYQHQGLSFKGIARAIWVNLRGGKIIQGGSTITQQLVKNFYLTPERSFMRKINEALMSIILEFRFSKDEILEAYLNEVYLGQDGAHAIHGFGLASEFYFSKPLNKLPLDQISTLIALVRGPSYYALRKQPERALKRRNLILDEMLTHGDITASQAQQAKQKPIKIVSFAHRPASRYPSFIDLVKRQLKQEYNEQDLTSAGLSIFTTLDSKVQEALDSSIEQKLADIERRKQLGKLEVAALVTRRGTGEIVALAGGRNSQNVGFNRALNAVRPIGSLMKPLVYLTALEDADQYTLMTPVSDTHIEVRLAKDKLWKPKNYDRKEHGEVALHTALAQSYNMATVRIGMDIGVRRIIKTLRKAGVQRPVNPFPSLLLGALALTPFEVTQMYQTLADDGFAMPLRSISAVLAQDGAILQRYPYTLRQQLDPAASYLTNTVLQEVMRQGTGKSAYKILPKKLALAGKTGTTNDLKDSWFAGYTGDYLAVFWLGRDDNKSAGITGASGALKLWTALMRQIAMQPVVLSRPDAVISVWIDKNSGLKANELCADIIAYPFVRGSEPRKNAPCAETTLDKIKNWFNHLGS